MRSRSDRRPPGRVPIRSGWYDQPSCAAVVDRAFSEAGLLYFRWRTQGLGLGQWARRVGWLNHNPDESAALQQFAALPAPARDFSLGRANGLFTTSSGFHGEEIAFAFRGNKSNDTILIVRQLDQNHAFAGAGEEIHL